MKYTAPQTKSFRLGQFDILVLCDGRRVMENPAETYGLGQPIDTVNQLLRDNFLPVDRMVNCFSPVFLDTGAHKILFDVGFGEMGTAMGAGNLLSGLNANGIRAEDITHVVMTHLHMDHFAGLMTSGEPTFKNARYIIGRTEFEYWTNPALVGTPFEQGHQGVLARVVPLGDKTTLIDDGDKVLDGVTAVATFGHSPGHMSYQLQSAGQSLMITGDVVNHFVLSLQRPDWHVRFDFDKEKAAATRNRILSQLAEERMPFIGYHMPFPGAGFVVKDAGSFRYVPVTYQFEG